MATTFTEAKATLDEIAERINGARKRMDQAYSGYTLAQSTLAGMSATYSAFIADLNAASTADSWPQADSQKAEKDQMVTEFQALQSEVDAIIAAIDAA